MGLSPWHRQKAESLLPHLRGTSYVLTGHRSAFFFKDILIYLFERQLQREVKTMIFHPPVYSPNSHNGRMCTGPKPGDSSGLPMWQQGPNHLRHPLLLAKVAGWKWSSWDSSWHPRGLLLTQADLPALLQHLPLLFGIFQRQFDLWSYQNKSHLQNRYRIPGFRSEEVSFGRLRTN